MRIAAAIVLTSCGQFSINVIGDVTGSSQAQSFVNSSNSALTQNASIALVFRRESRLMGPGGGDFCSDSSETADTGSFALDRCARPPTTLLQHGTHNNVSASITWTASGAIRNTLPCKFFFAVLHGLLVAQQRSISRRGAGRDGRFWFWRACLLNERRERRAELLPERDGRRGWRGRQPAHFQCEHVLRAGTANPIPARSGSLHVRLGLEPKARLW